VKIALVGKYVEHQDAYKSICESFIMAGAAHEVAVDLKMVLSDEVNSENVASIFKDVSGILIAPGFGDRGIEGKILSAGYAREKDIPFLGICLGMQCAVIEFARNVCDMAGANSTEFNKDTAFPVIDLMNDQRSIEQKGGTMRLGAYECELKPDSLAGQIYNTSSVSERHRHRFELNNDLRRELSDAGMLFSGRNPSKDLIEIIELPDRRWFIGVQFHPEYKTTVGQPHPLFHSFVGACVAYADESDMLEKPGSKDRKKKPQLASAKI